ncbi:MAG: GNAT family N-acetyltransferase [Burkholderiales bacterium]|nr:GNAT family N-acetyltransferase [Burkholderiales bacterium]
MHLLMSPTFECNESPNPADLAVVDAGIDQFNLAEPELHRVKPLAVFARGATENVVGGAVGRTWGQCCELQQLWTVEEARGQGIGTQLMNRFETEATRRACWLIYLDTFTFQARPFYESRGYRVVLETQGFTNGIVKYTMHKHLAPP